VLGVAGDGGCVTGRPVTAAPLGELAPLMHRWLLRLVGQVPDEALWAGRDALFAGRSADLASRIGDLSRHLPDPDAEPTADLFVDPGQDDCRAVEAVSADPDAVGLWACWAGPPGAAHRIRWYVAEVASVGRVLGLDRELHEVFRGQSHRPRVAVIGPGGSNSSKVCEFLEVAPLIWAPEPQPVLKVAPIFAGVAEDGSVRGFPGDLLPPEERSRVLDYLMSAEVVLRAFSQGRDLVRDGVVSQVSIDIRSDGLWAWSDATAYYLDEHDLRPCPGLLEHLRSAGPTAPALSTVAYRRVVAGLEASDEPMVVGQVF
jgi:hypothetical protein